MTVKEWLGEENQLGQRNMLLRVKTLIPGLQG